jgi:hypothetical protein
MLGSVFIRTEKVQCVLKTKRAARARSRGRPEVGTFVRQIDSRQSTLEMTRANEIESAEKAAR